MLIVAIRLKSNIFRYFLQFNRSFEFYFWNESNKEIQWRGYSPLLGRFPSQRKTDLEFETFNTKLNVHRQIKRHIQENSIVN